VQKWLDIIRGRLCAKSVEYLKTGTRPPFPYSDVRLLPYLQHSFWFLPNVAACHAMANLLAEKHNTSGTTTIGRRRGRVGGHRPGRACRPCGKAIGSGFDTKTITLSCGKLTTGVTVPQWSSILMLRNLKSPETYFQAAFRVQSPWSIKNPNGDNPNEEEILKPVCFVFDFAPTRALRQLVRIWHRPVAQRGEPGERRAELVSFLPVLAYDGANMTQIDAGGILDIAMAGTSATLLARKWESRCWSTWTTTPCAASSTTRGDGRRGAHRGLARAGRQHHRDHHQQEREGQGPQEQGQGRRIDGEGEEGADGRGEGIQIQAQAGSGEADQVRHPHSGLHVSDRLPRKHAAGRHHQAGTGLVP
jgi:hypothetical protein